MWGYGHYLLFAAFAAVGAGLDAAVQTGAHAEGGEALVVGLALAIPAAASVALIWALHAPLLERSGYPAEVALPTAVLILVAGALAPELGVVGATVAMALLAAASVAVAVGIVQRRPASAGVPAGESAASGS